MRVRKIGKCKWLIKKYLRKREKVGEERDKSVAR